MHTAVIETFTNLYHRGMQRDQPRCEPHTPNPAWDNVFQMHT